MTGHGRLSRVATSILAALTGVAAWFSAGTVAFTSGGAARVAALPPPPFLIAAISIAIAAVHLLRLRLSEAWPLAISLVIVLPFIPGPMPAAFMLWQGPLEVIVWTLVVVGLIAARGVHPPPVLSDPQRASWIVAAIVVTLSLFAFSQARGVVPSGDEPHYLVATQSLLADGDLRVENNYAAADYLDYFAGRLEPHFRQRSQTGEIYSIHSPGVSVVVLPAFAIGGYTGAVLTVIAIAALTAALTWALAWRVARSAPAAWIGVLAVFATAPFVFHTITIYPDGIGALMVIAAAWLIVRLDDDELPGVGTVVLIGAGLAALPWLHTRFALLSAVFGAFVIARLVRRGTGAHLIGAFLTAPIVVAATWFGYFWLVWGTPSPLAPYGRETESSLSYVGRGLIGLLFDQQHGVLGTAPIYAAALIGVVPLARQRRMLALAIASAIATYVIAVSTYSMWWGGTSAPARFLGAVLPLAAVAIASAWAALPSLRPAVLLLLVVSLSLVVPRLTEDDGRFIFNTRNAFDPTIEWLARHVDLAGALPSVHRDSAGVALMDAAPWLIAMVFVLGGAYTGRRLQMGRGAAWASVGLSGALTAMGAASVVWSLHGTSGITSDRSMLAADAVHRPWHSTYADLSRWQSMTRDDFLSRLTIQANAAQHAALMRLRRIPAGEYDINGFEAATVGAIVNRNDPVLDAGVMPFRLRLPVAVSSLSLRADTRTPDGTPAMTFTPVRSTPAVNADGRAAVRAARYGRARVFFFDERAYLEPKGFWTRAEGRATLVIDADDDARRHGLPIAFTAGAVATTIGISAGQWSESFSMTPGQRREITLPPLNGAPAWEVHIHSGPGFRPFEREPGSTDVRSLAAWFEIP